MAPSLDDIYQQAQTSGVSTPASSPSVPSLDDIYNQSQPTGISGTDIQQHPFQSVAKTLTQPAAESITGKNLEEQAREKSLSGGDVPAATSRPFDANIPDVQDSAFKNAVQSQVADAATTPSTYVGGKLVEGAANIVKGIADLTPAARNGIANMLLNPEFKQNAADWTYNHDARRVMATMPDIAGNDMDSTSAAIAAKTKETGQAIGQTISNSAASATPIGLTEKDIVGHIDDQIAQLNKADPNGNAATINRLMQKRVALTNQFDKDGNITGIQDFGNMTPQDAFDFKQQKLGNIKYTGNDATDTSIVNSALQKSRANLTDKMNTALPELTPLNQDYGDLLSASDAADRASFKAQGQGLSSIKWADVLTVGLNKWLFSPQNRIKMAQFLYAAPKSDIQAISQVVPNFKQTLNQVYALPSPSTVAQGQAISQTPIAMADSSVTKELPQYLKDRETIPPISVGKSSARPEAIVNNTNPNTQPNTFTPQSSGINLGPYRNIQPSSLDSLIKAHREVDLGNLRTQDIQDALDMGDHFRQNNISVSGPNVKKFADLNSLNKFVGDNEDNVELISTDDKGNFYAHLKGS